MDESGDGRVVEEDESNAWDGVERCSCSVGVGEEIESGGSGGNGRGAVEK